MDTEYDVKTALYFRFAFYRYWMEKPTLFSFYSFIYKHMMRTYHEPSSVLSTKDEKMKWFFTSVRQVNSIYKKFAQMNFILWDRLTDADKPPQCFGDLSCHHPINPEVPALLRHLGTHLKASPSSTFSLLIVDGDKGRIALRSGTRYICTLFFSQNTVLWPHLYASEGRKYKIDV